MAAMMPPGWSHHTAPDGRVYFYHAPSRTSQWSPPAPAPSDGGHHQSHGRHQDQSHPGPSHTSSRYIHSRPMEYKLQEKALSFSGDSFSVKDTATGQTAFKIKGNALSFHDSKTIQDHSGRPIYKMSESLLSLRHRMHITDAQTKAPLLTTRQKSFIPLMGTSTILVWRGSNDDGEPYLEVKGDFFRKDFSVVEVASGRRVAAVKRKSFTLQNLLLEKDTYIVRVEPGLDTALMVFLCVAIDEVHRDDGTRKGFSSRLGGDIF